MNVKSAKHKKEEISGGLEMKNKCFICGETEKILYNWSIDYFFDIISEGKKEQICEVCWERIGYLITNTMIKKWSGKIHIKKRN